MEQYVSIAGLLGLYAVICLGVLCCSQNYYIFLTVAVIVGGIIAIAIMKIQSHFSNQPIINYRIERDAFSFMIPLILGSGGMGLLLGENVDNKATDKSVLIILCISLVLCMIYRHFGEKAYREEAAIMRKNEELLREILQKLEKSSSPKADQIIAPPSKVLKRTRFTTMMEELPPD